MVPPILIKPIPTQIINEQAAYGPFNLKDYIQVDSASTVRFKAELKNGAALPLGMICTSDGVITGIPAKNTQGNYEVVISAENEAGSIQTTFVLTIKPAPIDATKYIDQLKAQVWQALEQKLPVPDMRELYDRPVTALDVYYLLERWGVLIIWDAFNLEPPSEKKLLQLEDVSKHYHVYDRGSCLVMAPKDLYSHERTTVDGLQTARALAREVYKRNWTIELGGCEKFTRAAWIEIQHLIDKYSKKLEIINYEPSPDDIKLYVTQSYVVKMRQGLE